MKKTLAILLALLMTGSIALVSCDNNNRTPVDDGWDDDNDYEESDESGDESGDENESESESESESAGGNNSSLTDWNPKSGTCYTVVNNVNLHSTQQVDDKNPTQAGPFHTALTYVESNGYIAKVKASNGTEYYVREELVTTDENYFLFDDCEDVTLTLTGNGMIRLRTSPYEFSDNSEFYWANSPKAAGVKSIKDGGVLTKVKVSKNNKIMEVTFKGTLVFDAGSELTYDTETTFYISTSAVSNGYINDSSSTGGGGIG